MDVLLAEVTLLNTRSELYLRFVKRRVTVRTQHKNIGLAVRKKNFFRAIHDAANGWVMDLHLFVTRFVVCDNSKL